MPADYHTIQMPEINSDKYRVIRGHVSPAGYPVGDYELIADNLTHEAAMEMRLDLRRSHHCKVVSIQVLPCFEDDGQITFQVEGPDVSTEFWSVYERHEDGCVSVVDDFGSATEAFDRAEQLAKLLHVEVEQYPWMNQ